MSKTVTLRVSEDHYEAFKAYAKKENRKLSNAIETLALKQLESVQFADEQEMAGILADKDLVTRIGRGVKDAKAKKGRLVE
jgi:predicted transcriptional regulator